LPKRGAAVLCPYEGSAFGEMAVVDFLGRGWIGFAPFFFLDETL
jgi:hypothetical protein